MKVAFITTVYDEAATLGGYLDSLAGQSRVPDQVIIVDGGSTDSTVDVALSRRAAFSDFQVLVQRCNIAQGRNLAVRQCKAEVVAMSDAGCLLHRDWLAEIVRPLEEDPAIEACCGNWAILQEEGFPKYCRWAFLRNREGFRDGPSRPDNPSTRSLAVRRSMWLELRGQPEFLYAGEDTLFNIKMRAHQRRVAFAPAAMCYWRMNRTVGGLGRQLYNYARANGRRASMPGLKSACYHLRGFAAFGVALLVALAGCACTVLGGHPAMLTLILLPVVILWLRNWDNYARARAYGFNRLQSLVATALAVYVDWQELRGFVVGLRDRMRDPFDDQVLQYLAARHSSAQAVVVQ
jgi:glycosyltransferase involved in cell wall biosynthesis